MQTPCVYIPGPAPAVSVANSIDYPLVNRKIAIISSNATVEHLVRSLGQAVEISLDGAFKLVMIIAETEQAQLPDQPSICMDPGPRGRPLLGTLAGPRQDHENHA